MRRVLRAVGVVGVVWAMLGAMAPPAMAAPRNDSPSTAMVIPSIPFSHTQDTTGADASGPRFCSNNTSVFFTFTPSDTVRVQVDTFGSDYDTVLSVYTRNGRVDPIRCNDDRVDVASGARFRARAGTTYFLMVAQCCGSGDSYGGGTLVLNVEQVSREPLEATLEVSGTGTVDPATGIATIGGTVTCSKRSVVGIDAILRQLRQGLFVARGYAGTQIACAPGGPVAWSQEVDTETGIAFGTGPATLTYWAAAYDGFRDFLELAMQVRISVELSAA